MSSPRPTVKQWLVLCHCSLPRPRGRTLGRAWQGGRPPQPPFVSYPSMRDTRQPGRSPECRGGSKQVSRGFSLTQLTVSGQPCGKLQYNSLVSCGRRNKISRGSHLLFPTSAWSGIPHRLQKESEGENPTKLQNKTLFPGLRGRRVGRAGSAVAGEHAGLRFTLRGGLSGKAWAA